jgi:hypothetical protein
VTIGLDDRVNPLPFTEEAILARLRHFFVRTYDLQGTNSIFEAGSAEAQFVIARENKDGAFAATFVTPMSRAFFKVNLHAVCTSPTKSNSPKWI